MTGLNPTRGAVVRRATVRIFDEDAAVMPVEDLMPKSPVRCSFAVLVTGLFIGACGGAAPARSDGAPPPVVRESQLSGVDGREICLVGRYGALNLDVHFGDPTHAPGYVVVWVGRQAVRLGLDPRPAEERDRLLDETIAVRGHFQLRPPPAAPVPAAPPGASAARDVTALESLPLLLPVFEPEPFRPVSLDAPTPE